MAGRRGNRTQGETVRGEYTAGEGWEPGQKAPATKYADMDGNVSDKPAAGGGHVIVEKGDVIRPHMVAELAGGGVRGGNIANEGSSGDASHSRTADEDADETEGDD